MSPVEVIAIALAAGAGAGVQNTASAAVQDAYEGLKALIRRRVSSEPAAELALDANETEPAVWLARIGASLTAAGADRDEEVLAAAGRLLELTDPAGLTAGKYHVEVRESKGVQVGDHNSQHNTFS
jgi:hypothetical protein